MTLVSNDSDPSEDRGRLISPPHLGPPFRTQAGSDVVTESTVRRWRAFALLVVWFFMTIVDRSKPRFDVGDKEPFHLLMMTPGCG